MLDKAQVCDEYGRLEEELEAALKPLKTKIKRLESLRAEIQKWYEDAAAERAYEQRGASFCVRVSERSWKTIVDKARLYARLRKAEFIARCTFTLTAAEDALSGEELKRFIRKEQSGHRKVEAARI